VEVARAILGDDVGHLWCSPTVMTAPAEEVDLGEALGAVVSA
jgi:hypothetical protein